MRLKLLTARSILLDAETLLDGGGVLIGDGRIQALGRDRREAVRLAGQSGAEVIDLGEGVITPGLVNAHAHLELSALEGLLPGDRGLVPWIGALLRERERLGPLELEAGLLEGAGRLRATGTTAVGDIDSTGAACANRERLPLRTRIYRELLDAGDPVRGAAALEAIAERLPSTPRVLEGIAPHATHTASAFLLEGCARHARRHHLPVTIHWAESPEEVSWLRDGSGPFAGLLGSSPECRGLERLETAGFEGTCLSLVHANHADRHDLETVARWGATLVHCPGTHQFFGREPVPFASWIDRGIDIALGTDSLASNGDLDLRREMALLRAAHPELSPGRVFDWATRGGAGALGLSGQIGALRVGAWADLAVFLLRGRGREAILDEITQGLPPVESTWVAGESS